jgi:D-threo-aldose 1-dehydrogenase
VSLPAAAIQFPLRDPAIAAVILGMRSAHEVRLDVAYRQEPIPPHVWAELDAVTDGAPLT